MKEKIIISIQVIVLSILFAFLMYMFELSTVYGAQQNTPGDELQMVSTTTVEELIIAKDKSYQQDKILACLLYLESTNRHDVIVLDTNNKYSIGGYQFQVDTVQDILARFEKRHVSAEQAVKIAKSPSESKELARRSIFDYGLASKWYNSFEKMKRGACGLNYQDLIIIKNAI